MQKECEGQNTGKEIQDTTSPVNLFSGNNLGVAPTREKKKPRREEKRI